MKKVGVVGLGYVGLPLAMQFASNGNEVIGFDVDPEKIMGVNLGISYIRYIQSEKIKELVVAGKLLATSDFGLIKGLDAIIICVPTPLTKHREPDIGFILSAGKQVGMHLEKGQLVVLESTTYPGTTDEHLKPVLEKLSKLKAGEDFNLAFSPEREDPGNAKFSTGNIPKIVGGMTDACRTKAMALYAAAGIITVPVSSNSTAEAAKLLENIFRCVNIALVNELKVVFDAMEIDVWEVIAAAKTKPFGYMAFYPGPGLGGHCIPIDPFYLTWKAREFGVQTKFIELAGEINTDMPHFVVDKLVDGLSSHGKALKDAKVLLLGVAYKKDVEDLRESPSLTIWDMLTKRNATVGYYDPFIPCIPKMHEHEILTGKKSHNLTEETIKDFDVVLILTDHTGVDYNFVAQHAKLIVDTRNACKNVSAIYKEKIIKA